MSVLYMIATPLGNLKDITLRALEILGDVDYIACEDTRHSGILLNAHGIRKPLVSCHGHNEDKSAEYLVRLLGEGKTVAYISDAGTPGISDPGNVLVTRAVAAGVTVVPVPGPSAMAALLSVVGLGAKRMAFEGFLSPKGGRRRRQVEELLASCDLGILYESPFRILALLDDIAQVDPAAQVVVGRELTKIHEEILRGTAGEIHGLLAGRPAIKGEFALAIQTSGAFREAWAANQAASQEARSASLGRKRKYQPADDQESDE